MAAATTIATTFTSHYVDAHPGATRASGAALTHGFEVAFYVLAGIAVLGAVIAAVMVKRRERVAVEADAVELELALEAA